MRQKASHRSASCATGRYPFQRAQHPLSPSFCARNCCCCDAAGGSSNASCAATLAPPFARGGGPPSATRVGESDLRGVAETDAIPLSRSPDGKSSTASAPMPSSDTGALQLRVWLAGNAPLRTLLRDCCAAGGAVPPSSASFADSSACASANQPWFTAHLKHKHLCSRKRRGCIAVISAL